MHLFPMAVSSSRLKTMLTQENVKQQLHNSLDVECREKKQCCSRDLFFSCEKTYIKKCKFIPNCRNSDLCQSKMFNSKPENSRKRRKTLVEI